MQYGIISSGIDPFARAGSGAAPAGTLCGPIAEASFEGAEVLYYNTHADVLTALSANKISAWIADEPIIRFMSIDRPDL